MNRDRFVVIVSDHVELSDCFEQFCNPLIEGELLIQSQTRITIVTLNELCSSKTDVKLLLTLTIARVSTENC